MKYTHEDEKISACAYILIHAFDDYIKYDYTMPDISTVEHIAKKTVDDMPEIPQDFKDFIYSATSSRINDKEQYASELENMMCSQWMFGREWFYGEGTYYRWRSEKIKKEIEKEIFETLNVNQLEYLHQICEKIKGNNDA
jgi:hypothetical protein